MREVRGPKPDSSTKHTQEQLGRVKQKNFSRKVGLINWVASIKAEHQSTMAWWSGCAISSTDRTRIARKTQPCDDCRTGDVDAFIGQQYVLRK